MTQYVSELELVNDRLKQTDELKKKFSGFPEVQEKLQSARDALVESEEEIMTYYDLTSLGNYNKS